MNEIYRQLAAHLNGLPVAFPASPSGVELRILEKWFGDEEARIALSMTGLPETAEAIAGRLGADAEVLDRTLNGMSKKGLIFRVTKDGRRYYNLIPLAEGMWEFHAKLLDDTDRAYLKEYLDFFFKKSWFGTKTTQHRVVPVGTSLTPDMAIMPYERAEEIIGLQSKIAVMECICRMEARLRGEGCSHSLEVCMAFGTGAWYMIENGLGREASREEALAILRSAMKEGLVLQPGNGIKSWNICMCCGCCCGILVALKKMEKPGKTAHTSFYSTVTREECTACGVCVERCPMGAISLADGAVVNTDRCIGCGVCVGACDYGAVKLRQKETSERYVPPANVVEMQMRIAKERGLL